MTLYACRPAACALLALLSVLVPSCSNPKDAPLGKLHPDSEPSNNSAWTGGGPTGTSMRFVAETREILDHEESARQYRAEAMKTEGPERERYLQLAEQHEARVVRLKQR